MPAVRKPSPGFGASRRLCCGPAGPRAGSLHRGRAPPSAPSPPAPRAQERCGRPRPHPNARGRPGSFFRLLILHPPSLWKTARPGGGRALSRLRGTDPPPLPRTRRARQERSPTKCGALRPPRPPSGAPSRPGVDRPARGAPRRRTAELEQLGGRSGRAGRGRARSLRPRTPELASPRPRGASHPPSVAAGLPRAAEAGPRPPLREARFPPPPPRLLPLRLPPSSSPPSPHPARSLFCSSPRPLPFLLLK